MSPSQQVELPDDEEDFQEDFQQPDMSTLFPAESVPTIQASYIMSTPLLVSSFPVITATPVLQTATINMTLSTRSVTKTEGSSSFLISQTVNATLVRPSTLVPFNTSIASTIVSTPVIQPTAEVHTSLPHATASDTILDRVVVTATPSSSVYSSETVSLFNVDDPVIKMMIMAEPRVPDERGYGDVLAKAASNEEPEEKSARFLYSNLLIPVMSGLFGALCITVIIMIIKCSRRRRLRKIQYYGGKPKSTLYGLDHMGLLSDMSSDEE